MTQPVTVAITGGVGAGKSETLKSFERHGAAIISSDEIVHELLASDADVKRSIVERFGTRVLDDAGAIDRSAVGAIVFAQRDELAWLEELLHPLVSAVYLRWRDMLAQLDQPPAMCVTEVPLLYESGSEEHFDVTVAITSTREARLSRAIAADAGLREKRLMPEAEKATRADYSFVNDGSLEQLDAFVKGVIEAVAPASVECGAD